MRNTICPNEETLKLFKKDLWKDQRRLDKHGDGDAARLVKFYDSEDEASREIDVINYLSSCLPSERVAPILDSGSNFLVFPYLYGIRVFNLLVELDRIGPSLGSKANELKQIIMGRCDAQQREIQQALARWNRGYEVVPYPVNKIVVIIKVLGDCLGIKVDHDALSMEVQRLEERWYEHVAVPFRDATTKNMVLADPRLWLGNFESEDARREFICRTLDGKGEPDWCYAPIYDFDFASCVNDTTPEDDVISLHWHERTWSGSPSSADALVWDFEPCPERAALTFLVRYYRFGGRKAAYRLLHSSGHRIRFRHDNDAFYFERLPAIMAHLYPQVTSLFPEILNFTEAVARYLRTPLVRLDLFLAAGMAEKRQYYVDMYPE